MAHHKWFPASTASYLIRVVSRNKYRLVDKDNGFDLDLTYVTDRIIALVRNMRQIAPTWL